MVLFQVDLEAGLSEEGVLALGASVWGPPDEEIV